MIARQRANLQRTFDQIEQPNVDARIAKTLAKTEKELAEATAEFTEGLESRFGPVPCLHEAEQAMTEAVAELDQAKVKTGGELEESALAGLIKARQNMRQLLSQSSSCASECRKFDSQQRQKLRPPKKDQKQEAQLQQEIEKLAKEERKLSQDIASSSSGAQSEPKDSKPEKNASKASPKKGTNTGSSSGAESAQDAKASPAGRQEKAAEKAAALQKRIDQDGSLTDLARERMDAATKTIQESAQGLREGRDKEAGQKAGAAADQLERLARQVAALKKAELAARLAKAQELARQLAGQQEGLGKKLAEKGAGGEPKGQQSSRGQAGEQRGQVEEGRTLADLLQRAQGDADGKDRQLGQAMRQASETHPPQAIVEHMQRAADALETGKPGQAKGDVEQAAKMLSELARQIESARRAFLQPQLEKLLAAEKQAAEAQKALKSVAGEGQKAEAEKKLTDLRDTLEALKPGDGKLAEAMAALAGAIRNGGGGWPDQVAKTNELQPVLLPPPKLYEDSVQRVVQALQAKIQEMILKEVLLDRDEAVPPQYKALVEEYYRILSQDLR